MKRKLILLPLLIFSTLLIFSGCDIIEAPYVENNGINIIDTNQVQRMILLEEFTGHKCGWCPEASALAHEYKTNAYAGRLIVVTIHAGSLAKPSPPQASSYTSDYRTTEGQEFYASFGLNSVPGALIDRSNNGEILGKDDWNARIAQQLQQDAEAEIKIENTYDAGSRQLSTTIDVKYLTAGSDKEHLSVFLVEDNIEDWQTDYNSPSDPNIPDYVHHDMFRGTLNSTWGEALSTGTVAAGDEFTRTYTYTLAAEFNASNCYIVAFAHNFNNYEVRQAAEAALIP